MTLDFVDTDSTLSEPEPEQEDEDLANATKNLLLSLKPCIVKNAAGDIVWNNDDYAFLEGECPPTANPSLWRQGGLVSKQGLFEVCEGIYQVRGLDLSVMSLIETPGGGVIAIDPLLCNETAAAGMEMYHDVRGPKPLKALIYTHSHTDHFGGAGGVLPTDWQKQGIPIYAPKGFFEHAVSENVYAGNAMARRAIFMYGDRLPKGPTGQIGAGLGQTVSKGKGVLIPPTIVIDNDDPDNYVPEAKIDGLQVQFQMTPGTEAPAEMNMYFPTYRALCMSENAVHTLHNIQTLRGAQVRDARNWSRFMDESLVLFGDKSDVEFASHHWPTWGSDKIKTLLAQQRDIYAFMHDQTLRMLNDGMTGKEISEAFKLPESLAKEWHIRGYYGSISHNVRGIYHRYMGWYDGNPAHLWQHPPVAEGKRYVDCMGGFAKTVKKAKGFRKQGDLRFAAQLLSHAVFADPDYQPAREELAEVFTELAYGCENGTWRNEYLTGAMELLGPNNKAVVLVDPSSMLGLTITQFCDTFAIRIDGMKAAQSAFTIKLQITDLNGGTGYLLTLSNGALTHRNTDYKPYTRRGANTATLTLWLTHSQFINMVLNKDPDLKSQGIKAVGDETAIATLLGLITPINNGFSIVTP